MPLGRRVTSHPIAWWLLPVPAGPTCPAQKAPAGGRNLRLLDEGLLAALLRDDVHSVRKQLDAGANPNACEDEHGSPLLSFSRSNAATLELLRHGADARQRDPATGGIPFVATRHPALLDYGADIDDVDADGRTALMSAVLSADEASVLMLLGRGADVNAQDESGRSALMIARSMGLLRVTSILERAGGR